MSIRSLRTHVLALSESRLIVVWCELICKAFESCVVTGMGPQDSTMCNFYDNGTENWLLNESGN